MMVTNRTSAVSAVKISPIFPHFCREAGTPGVMRVRNSPWQEQPEEEGGGDSIQHG